MQQIPNHPATSAPLPRHIFTSASTAQRRADISKELERLLYLRIVATTCHYLHIVERREEHTTQRGMFNRSKVVDVENATGTYLHKRTVHGE